VGNGRLEDERGRRLFAAGEVRAAGWGGLAIVSEVTGLARSTIYRGEDDLHTVPLPQGWVRRKGGGRWALSQNNPQLVSDFKRLIEPATLGDPMRPLIWVSKSMDKLAAALTAMGHPISASPVRCRGGCKLAGSATKELAGRSAASQRSIRPPAQSSVDASRGRPLTALVSGRDGDGETTPSLGRLGRTAPRA
jgi:hypothetical protein